MKDNYEPIKSMKEVPVQLRKLRREYTVIITGCTMIKSRLILRNCISY